MIQETYSYRCNSCLELTNDPNSKVLWTANNGEDGEEEVTCPNCGSEDIESQVGGSTKFAYCKFCDRTDYVEDMVEFDESYYCQYCDHPYTEK